MERSAEVAALVRQVYEHMRRGEKEALAEAVARDEGVVWIGTDPKEWWVGHDAVADVLRAQMEASGGFDIAGSEPLAYREGDVAWFADQAALRMPDGGEVPVRMTGVLHREDDTWRFVQCHASIGIANEEVLGETLPT